MAFTPKIWQNNLEGGTPLSAAALIDLETRLSNYTDEKAIDIGPWKTSVDTVNGLENGWQELPNVTPFRFRKEGDILRITGVLINNTVTSEGLNLFTLPEDYRPENTAVVGITAADEEMDYQSSALTFFDSGIVAVNDAVQVIPLTHITVELT
jgi:hypothetical protein